MKNDAFIEFGNYTTIYQNVNAFVKPDIFKFLFSAICFDTEVII